MRGIVGEYTLEVNGEVELEIWDRRIGSGCIVYEGKRYCRDKRMLVDATADECVVDYFDGEYNNARIIEKRRKCL